MAKKVSKLFEAAVALRDKGDLAQAALLLQEVVKHEQSSANAFLVLGDVHEDLGNIQAAVEAFRSAVALKPYSQLASIALFTVLWKSGQEEEALEEMKRFLSHSESAEYSEILAEIMSKIDT